MPEIHLQMSGRSSAAHLQITLRCSAQLRYHTKLLHSGNILAKPEQNGKCKGYPAVGFDAQHSDGSGALNLGISVRSAAHTALVREIGAAAAVLLKNNHTAVSGVTTRGLLLALARIKSMAVIGQDAAMPDLDCNDLGECNAGTIFVGWGSGTNSLDLIFPPIEAIKSFVGTSATIATSLTYDMTAGPAAATAAFFAMSGALGSYTVVVGNMGDWNDLDLWWKGGSLVEAVTKVCNNTIVVVHFVGPDEGTSIVYNSLGFPVVNYTEQLLIDYRLQGFTPHYEIGFGLSYTTFAYSVLSHFLHRLRTHVAAAAGEPKRVLRGFEEVVLDAGVSKSVSMTVAAREMSIWDVVTQTWVRPAGTFTAYVGVSIIFSSFEVRNRGPIALPKYRFTSTGIEPEFDIVSGPDLRDHLRQRNAVQTPR
ncbi:glycoside hydrolase family 3 C-terminal domain-containing protein [Mycena rebaudengoi]|nr:glycoside hydrolase family 3 C-terminal domain-containing protein [Mycena rebaudengoi]